MKKRKPRPTPHKLASATTAARRCVLSLREVVNMDPLTALVNDPKERQNKHLLVHMLLKMQISGSFEARYMYAGKRLEGRLYAQGLQSLSGRQRRLLAHGLYHDIDMVNSTPTILRWLCLRHALPTEMWAAIDAYVKDREAEQLLVKAARELGCSGDNREAAKSAFLAATHGGKSVTLRDSTGAERTVHFTKLETPTLFKYMTAVERCAMRLSASYQEQWQRATQQPNRTGSFVHHVCTKYEAELLLQVKEFLRAAAGRSTAWSLTVLWCGGATPAATCRSSCCKS